MYASRSLARITAALVAAHIMLAASAVQTQTTWYVDDDAPNDPGPGDPTISDALEDGSPEHPFDAIQEGIDAAVNGDTVLVLDGTYTGIGNKNLDFHGKAIGVHSENGPGACIVDCEGEGRGLHFDDGETQAAVVSGLTVRNGNAHDGGAICCTNSSPTIRQCTIVENTASGTEGMYDTPRGGGIYCYRSNTVIIDCTIANNVAIASYGAQREPSGGGISCCYLSSPTIIGCLIVGNRAVGDIPYGGGIHSANSGPTVSGCAVLANVGVSGPGWASGGGGIHFTYSGGMLANCIVSGNVHDTGAGIECYHSSPTIAACIIVGNVAQSAALGYAGGGGIECSWSDPTVYDCLIAGNASDEDGGAVCAYYYSSPSILSCTLAANVADDGGALYGGFQSDPTVTNCILWGNALEEIYVSSFSDPTVTYSDVQDGWPGEGNIDADPLFVSGGSGTWTADGVYDPSTHCVTLTDDGAAWVPEELVGKLVNPDTTQPLQFPIIANAATTITVWVDQATVSAETSWVVSGMNYQVHDYHLLPASACIDVGDPDIVPQPEETDIDGQVRVWDGDGDAECRVDMGSDEFGSQCPGDLDGDGDADLGELAALLANYGMTSGARWADGDLDCDGAIDLSDLSALLTVYGTTCD